MLYGRRGGERMPTEESIRQAIRRLKPVYSLRAVSIFVNLVSGFLH